MTERGTSSPELRELARAFESFEPSPGLRHRVLARTRPPSRVRVRPIWIAGAALALGVLLGLWFAPAASQPEPVTPVAEVSPPPVEPPARPESPASGTVGAVGPWTIVRDCTVNREGDAVIAEAGCRLELAELGVQVDVWEPATLRSTSSGVAMDSGVAAFAVRKRRTDEPEVEVDVSTGTIRVLGTRFVVTAEPEQGHVDLIEGRIAFEPDAGEVVELEPGRRLAWHSDQATVSVRPEPTRIATPGRALEPGPDSTEEASTLGQDLRRAAALRRRGDYGAAEKLVRQLLRGAPDEETRAVLSYELGTLLEASGAPRDACRHWTEHLRRYDAQGPRDVQRRLERLKCSELK